MKFIVLVLTLIALGLGFYHLYIIMSAKKLAKLVNTNGRYLWMNLKVIEAPAEFNSKVTTLIIDDSKVIFTGKNVVASQKELESSRTLESSIAFDCSRITNFDFQDKNNKVSGGFSKLMHKLFLDNGYQLIVEYLDENDITQKFVLSSKDMDLETFEASFADFDHKIYKNRTKKDAHDYSNFEDTNTVKIRTEDVELQTISTDTQLIDEPEELEINEETDNVPINEEIEIQEDTNTQKLD